MARCRRHRSRRMMAGCRRHSRRMMAGCRRALKKGRTTEAFCVVSHRRRQTVDAQNGLAKVESNLVMRGLDPNIEITSEKLSLEMDPEERVLKSQSLF
ncbi:hypothetical protein L3X38_032805 [Prunus dulcis]|uniref:Uncharacterized protein n=1 Tax=Prunus dulcis TaxID=3755 RepID=A0AAD4VF03_PRUDU|nr:hypothetical protein L3X38_032805 [Prunus dulcis]